MAPKVTIIGGGSSSFVPLLLRRLIQSRVLEGATVTLMDIDQGRLSVMDALAQKLIAAESSRLNVHSTEDQREALRDADFVIAAISVGGMAAWENDLEIPARYGLVMHVSDSVGPGGIMRTLRNAPVLAGVARDVAEVAPEAYVFNYTNPAPTEALAMNTVPGVKVFALCSCTAAPRSAPRIAAELGVDAEMVLMPPIVGGLNHCAAIVRASPRRRPRRAGRCPPERDQPDRPLGARDLRCPALLLVALDRALSPDATSGGAVRGPGPGHGHALRDHHARHGQRARPRLRAGALAAQWTAPGAPPVALADLPVGHEEEGIEVIDIIEAIVDNRDEMHIVNTVNHGTIPNLPPEAFVEVNTQVSAYGIGRTTSGRCPSRWPRTSATSSPSSIRWSPPPCPATVTPHCRPS